MSDPIQTVSSPDRNCSSIICGSLSSRPGPGIEEVPRNGLLSWRMNSGLFKLSFPNSSSVLQRTWLPATTPLPSSLKAPMANVPFNLSCWELKITTCLIWSGQCEVYQPVLGPWNKQMDQPWSLSSKGSQIGRGDTPVNNICNKLLQVLWQKFAGYCGNMKEVINLKTGRAEKAQSDFEFVRLLDCK